MRHLKLMVNRSVSVCESVLEIVTFVRVQHQDCDVRCEQVVSRILVFRMEYTNNNDRPKKEYKMMLMCLIQTLT